QLLTKTQPKSAVFARPGRRTPAVAVQQLQPVHDIVAAQAPEWAVRVLLPGSRVIRFQPAAEALAEFVVGKQAQVFASVNVRHGSSPAAGWPVAAAGGGAA